MVYVALATALADKPEAVAIALIVSEAVTLMGPVLCSGTAYAGRGSGAVSGEENLCSRCRIGERNRLRAKIRPGRGTKSRCRGLLLRLRGRREGPCVDLLAGRHPAGPAGKANIGAVRTDGLRNVNGPARRVADIGNAIGDGHGQLGAVVHHVHIKAISAKQVNPGIR